jgi:hypothetical protein
LDIDVVVADRRVSDHDQARRLSERGARQRIGQHREQAVGSLHCVVDALFCDRSGLGEHLDVVARILQDLERAAG